MMKLFTAAYIISYILAQQSWYLLSGVCLIFAAVFLYWKEYTRTENLLNFRGLLALGLLGGEGISCFKWSALQTDWYWVTWLCFYLFYLIFWIVYGKVEKCLQKNNNKVILSEKSGFYLRERKYRYAIGILLGLSCIAFIFEACWLGYIPLLTKNTPHAYSYFHVTGVHYFTTLVVIIPALGILYYSEKKKIDFICVLAFLIPLFLTVFLVSRFQFLFAVILALFADLLCGRRYRMWQVALLGAGMIVVYIIITVARAHSIEYLNGIFEMKNPDMPIFITQPYMYIANNYDNFDCMVKQIQEHSMGLKMLFPVFALTGLKFLVPEMLSFPLYTTKEELTTLTLLYDAYYDFGIVGIVIFAVILAGLCAWIADRSKRASNPIGKLIYVQIAFYLLFAFFTCWFSNPSTWFYLAVTGMLYIWYEWGGRKTEK